MSEHFSFSYSSHSAGRVRSRSGPFSGVTPPASLDTPSQSINTPSEPSTARSHSPEANPFTPRRLPEGIPFFAPTSSEAGASSAAGSTRGSRKILTPISHSNASRASPRNPEWRERAISSSLSPNSNGSPGPSPSSHAPRRQSRSPSVVSESQNLASELNALQISVGNHGTRSSGRSRRSTSSTTEAEGPSQQLSTARNNASASDSLAPALQALQIGGSSGSATPEPGLPHNSEGPEGLALVHVCPGSSNSAPRLAPDRDFDLSDDDEDDEVFLSRFAFPAREEVEEDQVIGADPVLENDFEEARGNLRVLRRQMRVLRDMGGMGDVGADAIQHIDELLERRIEPITKLGFFGKTGSGKSTLLSELLGYEGITPTAVDRSGTAFPVEFVYNERTDFRADFTIMGKEVWRQKMDRLVELLQAEPEEEERHARRATRSNSEDSDSKLECSLLFDCFLAVCPGARLVDEWTDCNATARARRGAIELIQEIAEGDFLDEIETYVVCDNLEDFVDQLDPYLASFRNLHHEIDVRPWPAVTLARLHLHSPVLRYGTTLVDLPGLADLDQVRVGIVRDYFGQCDEIVVVSNIERATADNAAGDLMSARFQQQVGMDNRTNLTFVCTKSDNLDSPVSSAIRRQYRNEVNTPRLRLIEERIDALDNVRQSRVRNRRRSQGIVNRIDQLRKAEHGLYVTARNEQVKHRMAQQIRTLFNRPMTLSVFAVSSRTYHIAVNYDAAVYFDPEIQKLRAHCTSFAINRMRGLTEDFLQVSYQNLLSVLRRWTVRQLSVPPPVAIRQQLVGELDRLYAQLRTSVDEATGVLWKEWTGSMNQLSTTTRNFVRDRGERVYRHLDRQLHGMHQATLQAMCRKGGYHVGSTGAIDFSEMVLGQLLEEMQAPWQHKFQNEVPATMDTLNRALTSAVQTFSREWRAQLRNHDVGNPQEVKLMERNSVRAVQRHLAQIEWNIDASQRGINRLFSGAEGHGFSLERLMSSAYRRAAMEGGTGMRNRMADLLINRVRERHALGAVAAAVDQGLDGLVNEIWTKVQELANEILQTLDEYRWLVTEEEELRPNGFDNALFTSRVREVQEFVVAIHNGVDE